MASVGEKIHGFMTRDLWSVDPDSLDPVRARLVRLLRLMYAIGRDVAGGELSLRAMSLVYTTLLSIVPLLAVSFSVLKGFGVHNQMEPVLLRLLAPLGDKGAELSSRIIEFVGNMKVGVLGSAGLALLIYTVVSVVVKIEEAFNHIWKVKRPRSLTRRFSDYMSVLLIGPILMFSAIGITAAAASSTVAAKILQIEPFGYLFYLAGKLLPYALVCGAFTFIYALLPSTKVNTKSAVVGGVFAGVLWESAQWGFASFIANSAKYSAIYSGFAILVVFMIWLYIGWLIILVGGSVSYYHQHPEAASSARPSPRLGNRFMEKLALCVMFLVGYNFHHGLKQWTLDGLVARLGMPQEPVKEVLEGLMDRGLLVEAGEAPPAYLPGRDLDTATVGDVLDSVRLAQGAAADVEGRSLSIPEVDRLTRRLDEALSGAIKGETLHDLVLSRKEDIT